MKKLAKKIIALVLAALMLAAVLPLHAVAVDNFPFSDVEGKAWYAKSVRYVYQNGLMNGTSEMTFSPEKSLTRAMLVTVLWRMQGSPSSGFSGFQDVPKNSYYSKAVAWAQQNDIVTGYSSTSFGPNDPITREQLTTLFYRYARYVNADTSKTVSLNGYSDWAKTSSWAKTALKWAVAIGLVNGTGNNLLAPRGNATRAQVAAILMRFCEQAIEKLTLSASKTSVLLDGNSELIFYYEASNETDKVMLFAEDESNGLPMFDDGNYASHGDDIAGDGVFSVRYSGFPSVEQKITFTAKTEQGASNKVSVAFYKPLTTEELNMLDMVGEVIDGLTESDAFQNQDEKTKASNAEAKLQELAANDMIVEDSIRYNEEEHLVSFTYSNGILGCVPLMDFDSQFNGYADEDGSVIPVETRLTQKAAGGKDLGRALILNSFPAFETKQSEIDYRTDYYVTLKSEWDNVGLQTTLDTDVTVDDYKKLANYNVVCFSTHGTTYDGQPAICLAEKQTSAKNSDYSIELKSGQIVKASGEYWIVPKFFEEQYGRNDLRQTFVFAECCCFMGEGPTVSYAMPTALISGGAKYVVGFHNSVFADYSRGMMRTFVNKLIDGKTASQAYDSAVNAWGSDHAVWFENTYSSTLKDWWEDTTVHGTPCPSKYGPSKFNPVYNIAYPIGRGTGSSRLINTGLLNGSIDLFHMSGPALVPTYWNIEGDVRSISRLGELMPLGENNNRMAIITSGIGSMQNAMFQDGTEGSRMYQTFVVPDDVSKLSFTYNFVSEEPMEYVGSKYNDAFVVQFLCDGEIVMNDTFESINSSNWLPVDGINFDGGDSTAFQTGWKTGTINLSAYRGKTVTISFLIYDVGDRVYDSACLLDNIVLK